MTLEMQITAEDWHEIGLGELATFRTGPFGSTFHKSDYVVGGTPLINPSHIVDGDIIPDETVTVRPELAKRLSVFALREGEIVIGRRGDMGRCAVVKRRHEGFLCGTGSMIVRPRPGINPHLLQALLSSPEIIAKIEENSVGTTMINLNQGTLASLNVRMATDLKEQEAIAEALSDADALIEGLERLIAKKRLIKQGAMQDLLTAKRRLPGFSGEWVETTLRKLLRGAPSYGINSAACPLGSGGYDYLRITDIDEHGRLRQDGRAEVLHSAATQYFLEPNDIVVARTGASTGKSHRYQGPAERTVYAGFLIKLVPAPESVAPGFLFQFMQTEAYWSWITENSARSGQPGINGQQLSGLGLVIPADVKEQQAIATILEDMDAEIQALEARLEKARQVKEGMMQNLLTGRIRLV